MPQPRKTLGDIHSDICLQLMRLMETQSKATLARWAIGYARKQYLPICREACPELETVVNDCMACAQQGKPAAQYKDRMRTAAALARASQGPAAQAAARAVAVACAVMQPPSNALGFLFYGAAATAYTRAGLDKSQEEYDVLAKEELCRAHDSLCACAIENEKNLAGIRWNC